MKCVDPEAETSISLPEEDEDRFIYLILKHFHATKKPEHHYKVVTIDGIALQQVNFDFLLYSAETPMYNFVILERERERERKRERENSNKSVSYTHLDVYKRQVITPCLQQHKILTNNDQRKAQSKGGASCATKVIKSSQSSACLLYTSRCV